MNIRHQKLASGRWFELSLVEQMANIGSEVERTISWRARNPEFSRAALERGLELIDLTVADGKNRLRLKELLRVREALADYFMFDNVYQSTDDLWKRYFGAFAYAAALRSGR